MKQDLKKKENLPETVWTRLLREWKFIASILGRPLIFLSLGVCIVCLYFANTIDIQPFSLVMNLAASILAGVASGGIWDAIKTVMGKTILLKKGSSAVRNLSLARVKIKNISDRTKMKTTTEEIKNLLALLEKDISNSLQEWNDVLPGVTKIEGVYMDRL